MPAIYSFKLLIKLILSIGAFILLSYCFHPGRFAKNTYDHIDIDDIPDHLSCSPEFSKVCQIEQSPFCVVLLNRRMKKLAYPNRDVSESFLRNLSTTLHINPGGVWKPLECISKFRVAIIVPYRDRAMQLNIFLSYMHPFLQAQMLEYRIVIVEQSEHLPFNRAKLFNIGFVETLKIHPYHCFIFHDVDLIPQNTNNIYACTHQPRHMSSSVNTFRYNLPYNDLFGGVVSMLKEQFEDVNGFSNAFYGWGGEDDDFWNRLNYKGLQICRFSPDVAKYVMLSHKKEPPSQTRYISLKAGMKRFESDGLNNLNYKVLKLEYHPLYTRILADLISADVPYESQ
ncbi:hypothetical protein J437_LFUL010147 [Ladona fulva]|uniref:Beta-1,4-N-acetylgalactosaminyltransferase n=1 Tax=Ladona fulva TaxID=123851 RepID=A0A8K0P2W8_LADFU|nr:hypothetical protein J437_LFUL010147 [Ladona fulva]